MAAAARLPRVYIEKVFHARRRLVEAMLEKRGVEGLEVEVIRAATLLSPMVATCGPAGPNVAPLMLSFAVKEEYLGDAIEELKRIGKEYWGRGPEAYAAAARFLLGYVYNPERADPGTLVTHLMTRGHTWRNIRETGEASVGILFPPDEGALELRVTAEIHEDGLLYEYVNRLHDLMHAVPHGSRSHEWFPALVLRVREIYDNGYKLLGLRIHPPPLIVVAATRDGRVYPGHFGDAEVYLYYRLVDGECMPEGSKENPYRGEHEHEHGHHGGHGHGGKRRKIAALIGEVDAVVAAAMGPGGREFFEERGVKVYRARAKTPVGEALASIFGCRVP